MPEAARMIAGDAGCEIVEVQRGSEGSSWFSALLKQAEGRKNLIFTENAHMDPGISAFISRLSGVSDSLHLIALRNPWDADIPGVENAVCSYGYTHDQQIAIYRTLIGEV